MVSKTSVLINASVITLDPHIPRACAVEIRDGKISRLHTEEIRRDRVKDGEVIDCHGKAVLPGFIDAHCHFMALARQSLLPDISQKFINSISALQSFLRKHVKNTPPGKWIRARGLQPYNLAEKRYPGRHELDAVSRIHPICITDASGYVIMLNSEALKALKITSLTEPPEDGVIDLELDSGEPSGILYGMQDYVRKLIPPVEERDLIDGIKKANSFLISNGVTSFHDVSYNNDITALGLYKKYVNGGLISPRVVLAFGTEALSAGANIDEIYENSEKLRISGVKIVLHETSGAINLSQQELKRILLDIQRVKQPAIIHAIEEHIIRYAITALRALPQGLSQRHRIEHCSVCPPELADELAKLKVCVVTHPNFLYYNGDRYLDTVPAEQLPFLYPFNTLLKKDIKLAAGSDSPVAPLSPLAGIYSAVTRLTAGGRLLNQHEAIDIFEAIKMYTINAAYVMGEDDLKGSLIPGKLADMVVLDADPTTVSTDEIKNINVDMVIIGGKVVYAR